MSKLKILSFLLVLAVASVSCSPKKSTTKVRPARKSAPVKQYAVDFVQRGSLTTVLDRAKRDNKLVFLDMYTDWCMPCKMMDQDVFTHKPTADYLNQHFVSYKVNAEKANGPDLRMIYNVNAYPTLLFLDHNGKVLIRKEGAAYHSELLRLADSALTYSASL